MSAPLYCSASTELGQEHVWSLFSDIENWLVCSDVYEGLRWEGSPWVANASIVGRVRHNRNEKIRYVVEKCEPAPAGQLCRAQQREWFRVAPHNSLSRSGRGRNAD